MSMSKSSLKLYCCLGNQRDKAWNELEKTLLLKNRCTVSAVGEDMSSKVCVCVSVCVSVICLSVYECFSVCLRLHPKPFS